MRRKAGALTQLEAEILVYAAEHPEGFHGWQFSKEHPDTPNVTIYRSLMRLQQQDFLSAERVESDRPWLPKRCMFRLTTAGLSKLPKREVEPTPVPFFSGSFSAKAL